MKGHKGIAVLESVAKALRGVVVAASDNVAFLVQGACRETYTDATEKMDPDHEPLFCQNRWPCEQCGAPFPEGADALADAEAERDVLEPGCDGKCARGECVCPEDAVYDDQGPAAQAAERDPRICGWCGELWSTPVPDCRNIHASAAPPAADGLPGGALAPPLKPGATSPAGHPPITKQWGAELAHLVGELQDAIVDNYDHGRVDAPVDTGWLSRSVDWQSAAATLIDYFDITRK